VVKFNGGREVFGELKSWDKSMNLILSNTSEVTAVEAKTEETRKLGLIIVKGSQIQCISLRNGYVLIDNPFIEDDKAEEAEGDEQEGEGVEGEEEA
jgi:small nuclear ribonucleoprotein (snRNP)-like protein